MDYLRIKAPFFARCLLACGRLTSRAELRHGLPVIEDAARSEPCGHHLVLVWHHCCGYSGEMARRRRNRGLDIALGTIHLIVLLVVAAIFLSQVRQMLFSLGVFLIVAVVLIGIVAFGVFLIRRTHEKPPFSSPTTTTLDAMAPPPQSIGQTSAPVTNGQARFATTLDLVEQLRSIDWFQFEKLVALVYRKLGYNVVRRGGANPDGGVDLIIEKDSQRMAVQCKQWKTWNVGVRAVREFLGALMDAGIQKDIFITLCGYTGEAKQLAEKHGIEILNEVGLARMLETTDARFDPETLALLRDTRKFCPKCESEMVLRTATKGLGAGKQFWGCSAYPRCRFTM